MLKRTIVYGFIPVTIKKSSDGYSYQKGLTIWLSDQAKFPKATLRHELWHVMQDVNPICWFAKMRYEKKEWKFLKECAAYAEGARHVPAVHREDEIRRYAKAVSSEYGLSKTVGECEAQIRKRYKDKRLY